VSLSSASAPPVKGVLSITSDARNPFFAKLSFFHPKSTKPHVFIGINFYETSPPPDPARDPSLLVYKSGPERGIVKRCEEIPLRSGPSREREFQPEQQKQTDSAQIQQRFDLKPFREQHKVQCCQECCRVGESVELAPSRPEFANRGRV